ncbi:hypothetical protein [Rhizobium sp. 42MFCr.1]|uniref:hypothetical protein n=1 Tax=Rhizobium sp. 42MFCr.1 TaxID=1048680 RepID=UPI001FD9FD83|nr:hypothetical protein [Rhizobium sp. 42MFCr.1]
MVPDGTSWQDLTPDLRAALENRAEAVLAADRESWGLSGLRTKEDQLLNRPSPAMVENIDRILGFTYQSDLPNGFKMSRDVPNAELKHLLIDIYLGKTASRGYLLYNQPEWRGWDGLPIEGVPLVDHEFYAALGQWYQQIEDSLRKIPDDKLTSTERAIREKTYFATRAGKHGDKPAVGRSGGMDYTGLYKLPANIRPFKSDEVLLDAYNASMFPEFRDVNVGTLDAFYYDYEPEFDHDALIEYGISEETAARILKIGRLYLTRTQALPDRDKRCTVFSKASRDAAWDTFTADLLSNADGSETMESYAQAFEDVAARRLSDMRSLGVKTFERMFPEGFMAITPEQRKKIIERLMNENRPAKMQDALLDALDGAGAEAAANKVREAIKNQPMVGGDYAEGEPVRETDKKQILDMWEKQRAFVEREYGGYRLDIASLIPDAPIILTVGQNQFTLGGDVTLSLGVKQNLVSFSSTMLHEMKHAIDQRSRAPVEGAAWEGAAYTVERHPWPAFIEEAMADQQELLPIARLKTEIDNVRFTATTDATLKVFLRESCSDGEPNSIDYVKAIVKGYGYDDDQVLSLRSRRAHRGTQYLEYDYGFLQYMNLLSYLQKGIGETPRVDAFLLQACKMPSPRADEDAVDDLKACIRERVSNLPSPARSESDKH